ncbi:hypothetical protein BH24ACT6_BH24ACT6_06930 [soil metagenome]
MSTSPDEVLREQPKLGVTERLSHERLLEEQRRTLDTPRRKPGLWREPFIRYRVIPQIIAFGYYQLSWVLYALKPAWSYGLNVDFEDHAEHEYARYVEEHPELEIRPYEGMFAEKYGRFETMGDLLRQISYDERVHKLESLQRMLEPRFV